MQHGGRRHKVCTSPGRRENFPPPPIPVTGGKDPGGINSTAVPTASHTARPRSDPITLPLTVSSVIALLPEMIACSQPRPLSPTLILRGDVERVEECRHAGRNSKHKQQVLDGPDKSENLSCDRKLCEKCLAQPFYIA